MSNTKSILSCAPAVATLKRDETLKVRVTIAELHQYDMAAERRNMDRSGWVRHALKMQAAREVGFVIPPPLQLDPKDVAIFKRATVRNAEAEEDKANG